MVTDDRRQAIDTLLREWDAGHEEEARAALLQVAKLLFAKRRPLLTLAEAREALGLTSLTALGILLRVENVSVVEEDGRPMVPLGEMMRLSESPRLGDFRALDRMHDEIANLGSDEDLNEDQLGELHAS